MNSCLHCTQFTRPDKCRKNLKTSLFDNMPCIVRKSKKWINARHKKAIRKLYAENGVGSTVKHRLAFWNKKEGDCYISHNPTDKEAVWMHERCWLFITFPEDFPDS